MATARQVKAGSAFVQFFLDDGKLQRGLKLTEQRLRQFGSKLRNIGAGALTAGLAGLSTIAFPFAKLAEFDDAIRATGAVTMATAAELRSMELAAKELGRTTSFTAVDVANLMTELGRAGFRPTQINEMTDAVLNLSRATGTEAPLAAGIMAASIRQFGLEATDATRIANVLTVAANSTFNTVEQLGESLSYAGPVAADLGMSLEDTVAILGTLGNVGIQGSNAGTAIRRLATLGAAEAEKLQKIFGVAFKDSAGNARPLVQVLGEVAEATDQLPTAERAAAFNEAFGLLGITAASAISKTAGQTKELADRLKNVSTEAADAAKAMDAGPGGMVRRLQSAYEGLQIAIGKAAEALASQWGESLTSTIGKATAFIENNQAIVVMVAKVAAGLAIAGTGLITLGGAMQAAALATGGLSTALALTSKTVAILHSVSLAGLYKWITVQGVPSLIAMTTATNAAKVAMVGLKVAVAAGVVYAIYRVSSAIYNANSNLRAFNKELEKSRRLSDELSSKYDKMHQKIIRASDRLSGDDQIKFLQAQLERAKKELEGTKASVKGQERVVGGLDTAFNNATGNKLLEAERNNLDDLRARESSLQSFTEQLEEALEAAKESASANNQPETEAPEKPAAPVEEAQKKAIKEAQEAVIENSITPDTESMKMAADLGAMAAFGTTGLAGLMGNIATNDDLAAAVAMAGEDADEARNAGIQAVANSSVNARSTKAQEEIALAMVRGVTSDQVDEQIKKNTLAASEYLKKIYDQDKKAPKLKVSKP